MTSSATISPPNGPAATPPRVRSVPDYDWSAGPEATALAASVGLIADDWQTDIITDQLGFRADGKFAALECGESVPRQNGKGGTIELRKLAGLFLLGEKLITYTAHQFKTAQEHFLRMKDYIANNDELSRRVRRVSEAHGQEGIELWGEGRNRITGAQRLIYVARSKGSGRGFTGGCLILDEAQFLTAKQVAALFATMSALSVTGNPQVLYYGTPPDPDESPEGGVYWISVRKRGLDRARRVCWHEYSPPDGYDRADRAVWRATNPALGIRISEEFVDSELSAMVAAGNPDKFDRERLGQWPPDPREGWRVIPRDDWGAAHDVNSQVQDPVCFAVAANRDRTMASIAVCGRRADGLRHVEIIERRQSVNWVVERVVDLLGRWRHCGVAVVASGPAGALIPDLEVREVDVHKMSTQDYAKACGMLDVGLTGTAEDGQPDPKIVRYRGAHLAALTAAVKAAAKHDTGDVWTFERLGDVDTSALEAFACALWGFTSFGQSAPSPPLTVSAQLRGAGSQFWRPPRLKL